MFFTSGFSSFMRESLLFYISLKIGVHEHYWPSKPQVTVIKL